MARNRRSTGNDTTVQEDTVSDTTTEFDFPSTHDPEAGNPIEALEPDADAADLDVETLPEADDEVEDIPQQATVAEGDKPAAAKTKKPAKEPVRGELPEGMVTPIGLTKAINEQGLYTNREGEVAELKPQMVYSYIKNAPKERQYPGKSVVDSVGTTRERVCTLEEGLAWWAAKNEAADARRKNAAEKAAKQAEAKRLKAEKATATEAEGDDTQVAPAEEAE
jgi:hypothetical protein